MSDTKPVLHISSFYGEPAFSDVTIKYSGKELKAHKIILGTRSPYLKRMFQQEAVVMVRLHQPIG